jgi:hypothetical protein
VVQVLLASGRVHAGGLQVPEWIRADPHFLPRRWDRQLLDPEEALWVPQPLATRVEVLKAPPAPDPPQPRP